MFRNPRHSTVALAIAAALAAPVSVQAGAISVNFNGSAHGGFQGVTVARDSPSGSASAAGAFSFTDRDTGEEFIAWCLDIDTFLDGPQPYTYTEESDLLSTGSNYASDAQTRLETLFDANKGGAVSTRAESAGFQLAIWDVIYDGDFDIDAGNLDASGTNNDILTAAQGYLTAASTYDGDRVWNIVTYDGVDDNGENIQDIGVATAIPLPAAAWMLLAVSGGLVAAKRRRSTVAA